AGLDVLVFPVLLPLLHAATRQAERIAAALRARLCLESQTGWDLTPGASFLLVRDGHGSGFAGAEPVGHIRVLADERQARGIRLLLQQGGEVGIAVPASDQTL